FLTLQWLAQPHKYPRLKEWSTRGGSSWNVKAILSNLDAVQREARLESSSEFAGLSFLVFRQGPPDREPVRIQSNCAHLDLLGLLIRDTIGLRHGPSERGPV